MLILFTVFGISLCAQRLWAEPQHYVGVKGGMVMSWVNMVPNIAQGMHYSFVGGAVWRMQNEKYFGIQLEANYAQRGWSEDKGYQRTLGYIEVPCLAHITFGKRLFKFYINLGPSISLLVNEQNVLESSDYVQQKMPVENKFDYSIMGGLGFEFHTNAGVWMLEGKYSFGLGDMFDSSAGNVFRASSNQNIYITLGWMINVNRK